MKKITLILSMASLLLITTGCEKKKEEKPRETFKSYEYYVKHKKEMLVRYEECKKINYEMSYATKKDCKHAKAAYSYHKI